MSHASLLFLAVEDEATARSARALIGEYLHWVAQVAREHYGLQFDVEAMIASDLEDRSKFYPPHGRMYVVRHDGADVGVGCLKRLSPDIAELQRMYLQPRARGIGAGRRLLQRLLDDARTIGYSTVRLESLKALAPAHALYRSAGFVDVPPYAENSMEGYQPSETMGTYRSSAVFMELRL